MKFTLSISSNDPSNNTITSRAYGNINKNYVRLVPAGANQALPYLNGTQYQSFAAWTNAVARGIIALSNNSYINSAVAATFDINEELNS